MRSVSVTIGSFLFMASVFWIISGVQAIDEDCWAVLLEMNEFPEGWSDLPMDYINSERMQIALLSLGVQSDHIHTVNENLTIDVVQDACMHDDLETSEKLYRKLREEFPQLLLV